MSSTSRRAGSSPARPARRGGWLPARAGGRAAVAPRRKLRARPAKLEQLASTAARGSPSRSGSRAPRPEQITDRLVSIADPDARPIRKGKLGKPTEFGYVAQICEVTENTRRGARGLILPAGQRDRATRPRTRLLPRTVAELERLGSCPAGGRADGGFNCPARPSDALPDFEPTSRSIAGRHNPARGARSDACARYRTGTEGRISHLKRGYGLRRIAAEGPRRDADLDRLGDPRLQPRHPRHPNRAETLPELALHRATT